MVYLYINHKNGFKRLDLTLSQALQNVSIHCAVSTVAPRTHVSHETLTLYNFKGFQEHNLILHIVIL